VRESFNLKKGEEERVGRLSVGRTNKGNEKEYVKSKGIRENEVGVERGQLVKQKRLFLVAR